MAREEKGWRSDIIGQSVMELVLFWAGWAEVLWWYQR